MDPSSCWVSSLTDYRNIGYTLELKHGINDSSSHSLCRQLSEYYYLWFREGRNVSFQVFTSNVSVVLTRAV